jgi:hypothetical protein
MRQDLINSSHTQQISPIDLNPIKSNNTNLLITSPPPVLKLEDQLKVSTTLVLNSHTFCQHIC